MFKGWPEIGSITRMNWKARASSLITFCVTAWHSVEYVSQDGTRIFSWRPVIFKFFQLQTLFFFFFFYFSNGILFRIPIQEADKNRTTLSKVGRRAFLAWTSGPLTETPSVNPGALQSSCRCQRATREFWMSLVIGSYALGAAHRPGRG